MGHVGYEDNATNYNHLANMFHVHYRSVSVSGLEGMRDAVYTLSIAELEAIVKYVREYVGYIST